MKVQMQHYVDNNNLTLGP